MKKFLPVLLLLALLISFAPTAKADANENMQIIYTYLTETLGMNRAVACGILANIKYESNFNPEAIGDSGNAYGICQWNSRRQSLINYCEKNGFESWKSLEGQLGYLAYELENNKKSVGEFLKTVPNTAQGAYDAAYHFCVYYEIPANRYVKGNTRGTAAVNTYWTKYGGAVETYTVTYNANGGKNAPAAQTKKEGIPLLLSSSSPSRTGYTHIGWAKSASAANVDFDISGTYSENESITLYAVWEKSLLAETEPDKTVSVGGHTYEYYSGAYTYAYAQSFADIKGGYLASVTSSSEYSAVLSLTQNALSPCWLGGEYTSGNWTWATGEAFMDDFAQNKWAADEPSAQFGPNAKGRLVQTPAGEWKDYASDSLETGGFIVEYGAYSKEELPVYLICVESSLRLREGPGTSYDTLAYMYPGALITIYDIYPSASYNWGWGITDTGAKGWCAMRIPSYMIEASGVDEKTGLVYCLNTDGVAITGYTGTDKNVTVPDEIGGLKVTEILSEAFTRNTVPDSVALPAGIRDIASGAFDQKTAVRVSPGSPAHAACVNAKVSPVCVLPEGSIVPPASLDTLEEEAFMNIPNIMVVDLSSTAVSVIPKGAFSGTRSLTCVMLPPSLTRIEDGAFDEGCSVVIVGNEALQDWCDENGLSLIPVFE